MSELHESQFRAMQAAFARQGAGIEVAFSPNGRPDYIYQAGRLLVDVRVQGLLDVLKGVLPGIEVADKGEQPLSDSLRVYSIESVQNQLGEPVYVTVPEALDLIDAYLREHPLLRKYPGAGGQELARSGEYSPVTPLHVLHIRPRSSM